ncbi:MAG: GntR family transcriptional regulator [Thermoguttaceae bacterium]|nr:GntR family transcriptional regulator [Thermoguttaceae bacterium]
MQDLLRTVNRINDYVVLLENDIRKKKLAPGDKYYTAAEAGRFLGVAVDTANKALQVLEKKGAVTRQKKIGTVIADPARGKTDKRLSRIHFLLDAKALSVEGIGNIDILGGLQSVFPVASVNYSFIDQEETSISRLFEGTYSKNNADAFVLVSVPYQIQQLLASTDSPAVIFGSRYHISRFIPSIEQDFHQVAEDVFDYFKEKKRKKTAILLKQTVLGGDAILLNELLQIFPGKPPLFFLPDDPEMIFSELADRFGTDFPDFIISTHTQFTLVADRLRNEKKIPARDCDLVTIHPVLRETNSGTGSYFIDTLTPFELGELIGHSLQKVLSGDEGEDIRLPMRLVKVEEQQ